MKDLIIHPKLYIIYIIHIIKNYKNYLHNIQKHIQF